MKTDDGILGATPVTVSDDGKYMRRRGFGANRSPEKQWLLLNVYYFFLASFRIFIYFLFFVSTYFYGFLLFLLFPFLLRNTSSRRYLIPGVIHRAERIVKNDADVCVSNYYVICLYSRRFFPLLIILRLVSKTI